VAGQACMADVAQGHAAHMHGRRLPPATRYAPGGRENRQGGQELTDGGGDRRRWLGTAAVGRGGAGVGSEASSSSAATVPTPSSSQHSTAKRRRRRLRRTWATWSGALEAG
jgi:hypothetical protein